MQKFSFRNRHTMMALLLLWWVAASCKKLIQIPPNPPTSITEAQQFADSATAMTAVAGVYTYSRGISSGFTYSDGYLSVTTGLSSDELSTTWGQADYLEFYNYSLTSLNDIATNMWTDPYTGLYPVNAILRNITNNSALSASFTQQITGEMKVVRALYYFNLVNVFGAVPLVTSTDYTTNSAMPRTSVDSVYTGIIADLTDALQELTPNYPSSGSYRPNLYVASALLARIYLYRQQWQNAYDAATTVIGSGVYSLEPDLNNVFLDGSIEAIWQIPATGTRFVTMEAENYIPESSGTVPNYLLTPWLLNAFEAGDQRLQDWTDSVVVNTGSGNQTFYYPYKYKNVLSSSPTTEDFMILRLAEQYLIRAEASAQLGNTAAALADLNVVRARAGLAGVTAASPAAALSAIMHERQIEFFTEWGNRWYDLKRTGMAATVLGSEKTGWQTNAELYPVPRAQLTADPLLTQNQGY